MPRTDLLVPNPVHPIDWKVYTTDMRNQYSASSRQCLAIRSHLAGAPVLRLSGTPVRAIGHSGFTNAVDSLYQPDGRAWYTQSFHNFGHEEMTGVPEVWDSSVAHFRDAMENMPCPCGTAGTILPDVSDFDGGSGPNPITVHLPDVSDSDAGSGPNNITVTTGLGDSGCCNESDMPACLFGPALCCRNGTWTCRVSFGSDYECHDGAITQRGPQGHVCGHSGPWDYQQPSWWDIVVDEEPFVKKCKKRPFPPTAGTPCPSRPKTCFWGSQDCSNSTAVTYPTTKCSCDGSPAATWSCEATICPAP